MIASLTSLFDRSALALLAFMPIATALFVSPSF